MRARTGRVGSARRATTRSSRRKSWKRLAATYKSEARERASRQAVLEQANRALIARIRRLETELDEAQAQVPQRRPAVGEIPTGYDPIEEARRWLGEQGLSR